MSRFFTPGKVTLLFWGSAWLFLSFSAYAGSLWLPVQQFIRGVEFGIKEPIFQRDASFYIFQLPFWRILYTFTDSYYYYAAHYREYLFSSNPTVQVEEDIFHPAEGAGASFTLVGFLLLLKAWDYRLKMFELLFSRGDLWTGL